MKINKFFDKNKNSLRLIGEIGISIKNAKSIPVNDLILEFSRRYPDSFNEMAFESLSALFCLGKIKYNPESDTLEYAE